MDSPVLEIQVAHLPTGGRGSHVRFTGDDMARVGKAAMHYWSVSDEWLRGEQPIVRPLTDGRYCAEVRIWSAE
jgi:hypothetical protein